MNYDSATKLSDALASLHNVSPKNHNKLAALTQQAKDALRINTKAKRLPDDTKRAIFQWHVEQLKTVQDVKQDDDNRAQGDSSLDQAPILKNPLEPSNTEAVPLPPDNPPYHHDLDMQVPGQNLASYENFVHHDLDMQVPDESDDVDLWDFEQVHFGVTIDYQPKPKRTTVMLEGYLVKAMQRKLGLTDNASIRAWIEQAIKADGWRFDCDAPLTRQVKRLIIESLV